MANPLFEIVSLPSGECSVRDTNYDEIFHPVIGPRQEARLLYVNQLRLDARLAENDDTAHFVVWDVGLGIGANATAVLETGMDHEKERPMRLTSFDKSTAAARFALDHAESLPHLADRRREMELLLAEHHVRLQSGAKQIEWHLIVEDFPTWLARFSKLERGTHSPHAILFDPCSPARNPEMWTASLFRNLYQALDPSRPCSLATYSRATHVRVALLLAGFYVGRGQPAGAKEETTVATNSVELIDQPLDRTWLNRIHTSSSAEPLTESGYRQARLSDQSRTCLETHPQFV